MPTPMDLDAIRRAAAPTTDAGAYNIYGNPEGYDAYASAQQGYGQAEEEAKKWADFDAIMARAKQSGGKLSNDDKDYLDSLWDQLHIPGDFRGGIAGNDNPLDYFSGTHKNTDPRNAEIEKARQQYVDQARAKSQQTLEASKKAMEEAKAKMGPDPFKAETDRLLGHADDARAGNAVTWDTSRWDADRANQGNALEMYRKAAMGEGPSAAQAQFQSALDQSNRAGMGLAASATGGPMGRQMAMRQALLAGDQARAQAVAGSAALRAQEQQAGMAGYSGLASDMAGLSQNYATNKAGLDANVMQMYENMRQNAYANQANARMAKTAQDVANRQWYLNFQKGGEQTKHERDNEVGNAIMGGISAAANVASNFIPVVGAAKAAGQAVDGAASALTSGTQKSKNYQVNGGTGY